MRLQDKAIVVTGSTTGIGEAMCRRFVAEGARVLVHGRDAERGGAVAASLGEAAAFARDDLADPAAPARLVEAALAAFGRLDGLVNNAAWVKRSDLATTDAALFDRMMAINVRSPLLLIQAALPHLKAARGSVLNIGSINGLCGEANLLAYSLSKGAMITLSRNLADALCTHHVRVNHFNLGWVLSPNEYRVKIADGLDAGWPDHVPPAFAPSGRIMDPEHVAEAAVYWIGDESRPVSGTVLEVEQYPVIGRNPFKAW